MRFLAPKGKKLCGIYCIRNILDGKCYYGQSDDIRRRFRNHRNCLAKGTHDNPRLQNAYNKHGSDAFEMSIVELLPVGELNVAEQVLLTEHAGKEHCYNIMRSVEQPFRGQKHSVEALQKMSRTWFGKGDNHINYGKHLPEETCKRISEAHKGKVLSEETKKKLSELNSGEKHPFFGKRGSNHPAYGHKWSEETREKMAVAIQEQQTIVVQYDRITGMLLAEFESLKAAEKATGVKYQGISRCCRGIRPSAGGFLWKYKGENECVLE